MICFKCGANNIEGSSFCIKCGANLKENEQTFNPVNNVPIKSNEQMNVQQEQSFYNQNSTNNQVYSQPIQNTNSYQNVQPNNNLNTTDNNKNNKKIMLISIISAISVILVVVLVFVIKNLSSSNDNSLIKELYSKDSLIKIKKDGKYGFINLNGKFVIEPKYESATEFYGNFASVSLIKRHKYGSDEVHYIIDKSGKVRMTTDYSVKYIDGYNVWIIDDQLYNDSLKRISPKDVSVEYEDNGYFRWENETKNTVGIMNKSGKITYTYKLKNDKYVALDIPNTSDLLKEKYCIVKIDGEKQEIINCETGKVIYTNTNADRNIYSKKDNIFELTESKSYDVLSKMYIQNNKIVFETSSEEVDLYFNNYGYIEITDYDKDYDVRYSYIDISSGKITNTKPNHSDDINLTEWEKYTKLTEFTCNSGYGLMSGKKVKLSCQWSSIKYLDIPLYKYLSSKGKNYVLAEKDNITHLINIKNGKSVKEFNSGDVYTNTNSSFIFYNDAKTNKKNIYNLITGKSLTVDNSAYIYLFSNYMYIENDDKLNYYNIDLKLIYSESE